MLQPILCYSFVSFLVLTFIKRLKLNSSPQYFASSCHLLGWSRQRQRPSMEEYLTSPTRRYAIHVMYRATLQQILVPPPLLLLLLVIIIIIIVRTPHVQLCSKGPKQIRLPISVSALPQAVAVNIPVLSAHRGHVSQPLYYVALSIYVHNIIRCHITSYDIISYIIISSYIVLCSVVVQVYRAAMSNISIFCYIIRHFWRTPALDK